MPDSSSSMWEASSSHDPVTNPQMLLFLPGGAGSIPNRLPAVRLPCKLQNYAGSRGGASCPKRSLSFCIVRISKCVSGIVIVAGEGSCGGKCLLHQSIALGSEIKPVPVAVKYVILPAAVLPLLPVVSLVLLSWKLFVDNPC